MNPSTTRTLRLALIAFAATKVFTIIAFDLLDHINKTPKEDMGERIIRYYYGWDSGWYGHIARAGYDDPVIMPENNQSPLAFYPLYPLTIRLVSSLTGLSIEHAGILNANVFHLVALILFAIYCKSRGADWITQRNATLLFAFCPQGIVFASGYSESLFVTLALAALITFESGKWYACSLWSAALSAVRPNGVFILIYYTVALAKDTLDLWKVGKPILPYFVRNSGKLLPILFTPLGLFVFWWFSFNFTGDAFAQKSTVFHGWSRSIVIPFSNFPHFLTFSFESKFFVWSALAMFALSFLLLPQKLYKDFAFCLANFLLFFAATIPDSMLRYSIVLFPIYLGVAMTIRNRPAIFTATIIVFICAQLYTSYAWYERLPISL